MPQSTKPWRRSDTRSKATPEMSFDDGPPDIQALVAESVSSTTHPLPTDVTRHEADGTAEKAHSDGNPAVDGPSGEGGSESTDRPNADTEGPELPEAEAFYPAFDFAESSLEAIAAAQIAAGLGDFNFESADGDGGGDAEQEDQAAEVNATEPPEQRGTKRSHDAIAEDAAQQSNETATQQTPSAADLLDQFTTTAQDAPGSQSDAQPVEAHAAPPAPVVFQKAFSTLSEKSASTENAFQKNAPAQDTAPQPSQPQPSDLKPTGPPATDPVSRSPLPTTAGTTASSAQSPSTSSPAVPATTLSANTPRPVAPPTSALPRPSSASSMAPLVRPIAPPIGTMPRPMPRPTPLSRPPPPLPRPGPSHFPRPIGGAPPSFRPRPPGPALPAAALFSARPPPGAPSFAALLSTLGPQDLAMVAHAAMGLDANGNPLPGNEESHKALAEAMRRLRESTSMRPPPQGQAFGPRPTPPPASSPASRVPGRSPATKSSTPKAVTPKPPKPLPPPVDPNNPIDALPMTNQGNPLEEKRPLIAGPKPDRAPPKPGPPPEKRFQCPKCDRAFARAYNLNTHLSTHDPDPVRSKPFPCPYPSCKTENRSFSRKHDLQRHIASTHEAEPEPVIEEQDENGELIHTNLLSMGLGAPGRKFRCECGRAFVRRDALRRHHCEATGGIRGTSEGSIEPGTSPSSVAARGLGQHRLDSSFNDDSGDLDDMPDFDAVAASLTESAAAEMRAAQAHADRQDDSEEPEEVEQPTAAAKSKERADGENMDEEAADDNDDAINNFVSEMTGDLNLQLGLDMDDEPSEGAASQRHEQETSDSATIQSKQSTVQPGDSQPEPNTLPPIQSTASVDPARQQSSVNPPGPSQANQVSASPTVAADLTATSAQPQPVTSSPGVTNVSGTDEGLGNEPSVTTAAETRVSADQPQQLDKTEGENDAPSNDATQTADPGQVDVSMDDPQFENAAAELMAQVTASIDAEAGNEVSKDIQDDAEPSSVPEQGADIDPEIDELDVASLMPTIPGLEDDVDMAEEKPDIAGAEQQMDSTEPSQPPGENNIEPTQTADSTQQGNESGRQMSTHQGSVASETRIKEEPDTDNDTVMHLAADTSIAT